MRFVDGIGGSDGIDRIDRIAGRIGGRGGKWSTELAPRLEQIREMIGDIIGRIIEKESWTGTSRLTLQIKSVGTIEVKVAIGNHQNESGFGGIEGRCIRSVWSFNIDDKNISRFTLKGSRGFKIESNSGMAWSVEDDWIFHSIPSIFIGQLWTGPSPRYFDPIIYSDHPITHSPTTSCPFSRFYSSPWLLGAAFAFCIRSEMTLHLASQLTNLAKLGFLFFRIFFFDHLDDDLLGTGFNLRNKWTLGRIRVNITPAGVLRVTYYFITNTYISKGK